jgi:hypothetical protein
MTLDQALDEIYRSWLRVQPLVKGRFDRETRHPEIVAGIARELGLLPNPARVLKVTGSKGKGTTARFAADLVAQVLPGARVALFVSPHEVEQRDRIRLDGQAIPEPAFCETVARLAPIIRAHEARLSPEQYVSPVGYFLLIALDWYSRNNADWFVLECGRGARWDEVGGLPAHVAIVTSVLFEHADKLGPTLQDIAEDKFSVRNTSSFVVASQQAASSMQDQRDGIEIIATPDSDRTVPAWIAACQHLARRGAERLLDLPPGDLANATPRTASASFGQGQMGGTPYIFEAAINADSLDPAWLDSLRARAPEILVCLSDDKDRAPLLAMLESLGPVREIALTGQYDYLHFTAARQAGALCLDVNDASGLRDLIRRSDGPVYLVGTQSFIRLLHRAQLLEDACSA